MNSFVNKIYAFKFFDDFVLIYPLYTVMFATQGLSPIQISILLTVWSVTSFILEIPSGVWADTYSRKNILCIGQIIRALGYTCWLLFPTFWGFLIGFILWGVKSALTSGTFQALLYDELKREKKESQFTKIYGKTKTISFIAILCASILASPAVLLGYPFVLVLSITSVLIAGALAFSLPKAQPIDSTREKNYLTLLVGGFSETLRNKAIIPLILFLSLTLALGGGLDEYWTLFAHEIGTPLYGLGIFLGVMSLTQALASLYVHRFEQKSNQFFFILFGVTGVILLGAGYIANVFALFLLVLFSFTATIIQTVFESRLQHQIPSTLRATISSINGFATEIFVLLVYFSVGIVSQIGSYHISFMAFGVAIVLISIVFGMLKNLGKDR